MYAATAGADLLVLMLLMALLLRGLLALSALALLLLVLSFALTQAARCKNTAKKSKVHTHNPKETHKAAAAAAVCANL